MGQGTLIYSDDCASYLAQGLSNVRTSIFQSQASVNRALSMLSAAVSGGQIAHNGSSYRLIGAGVTVSGSTVSAALSSHARALGAQADHIGRLATSMNRVAQQFRDAENAIAKMTKACGGDKPIIEGHVNPNVLKPPVGPGGQAPQTNWLDAFIKYGVSNAGNAGELIEGVYNLFTGDHWGERVTGAFQSVATVVDWAKGGQGLEGLLGLDDFFDKSGTGFWDGVANHATDVVPWVTSALTAGYKNYMEYKTGAISGDRAVVEWGAETLADVALKLGSAALVGTAFVAAGVTAPSVLLVGVVSTVAVDGVDWVWSNTVGYWITGENTGIVETVGHVVGEAWDTTKEAVGNVWEGTKAFVSDAVEGVGDFFGSLFAF